MAILVPSKVSVGLVEEDRALIGRLVSLLETLVSGKELVVRVSLENKPTVDDIQK
jgi:hypothetical protein